MLRFFARTPTPLMAVTAGVSLAPIVQAVRQTIPLDNSYLSFENAFAAPEPSSALVDWVLSGRLGDCLEWFGEAGASLGREFIPEQSIAEHKQALKHYAAKLTDALIEVSFNEEASERDNVFEMSDLLHYVYHAKQLLQKTDGDMAQEIYEQLGFFYTLAKQFHTQRVARPFEELRKGLAQRYVLASDDFPTNSFDESRSEAKLALVKQATFSQKQKDQIGIGNEADRVLKQMDANSSLTEIPLASLDGGNGFTLMGEGGGESGYSVSGAGDVNGDGIDDIVIGAPVPGLVGEGKSYVVFGRVSGFGAAISLANLDGMNGFELTGDIDESGYSVSGAGDVNQDGIDDVMIGAPFANNGEGQEQGKSYVIFGSIAGFNKTILLASLNGTNGFALIGEADYDAGYAVSSAGDVNHDGIDDVVIGAPAAPYVGVNSMGKSYVVFGRKSGFAAVMSLARLNGTNGFVLAGEVSGDGSGSSVSGAGDVNGDGIADVLIGAPGKINGKFVGTGKSYVVFGRASGFSAEIPLSSLDGTNGFMLTGEVDGDGSGYAVSGAGDVNGDGIDDVLIGAPYAVNGTGKSYVVFGQTSGFAAEIFLSNLNGTNGFALIGKAVGDEAGYAVSSAGDVNGDGIDDVLIGAPYAGGGGKSYVVFGRKSEFDKEMSLSNLNETNGFVLAGENNDGAGYAVSGAGDVNGDGIDDVLIGAPYANNDAGKSYVVFSRLIQIAASPISTPIPTPAPTPSVSPAQVPLSELNKETGMVFIGGASYDNAGWSVSSAGDINGDKLDDVIIGAPYANAQGRRSGKSYVIFGNISNPEPFLNLSNLNGTNGFVISGESEYDYAGGSVSTAGDVNADKVDDVVIGAFRASSNGIRAGKGYVIFGKVSDFSPLLNISSLNGTNGFVLTGEEAFDGLGYSVSNAGDVNGDKVDDVIIGAPFASANGLNSGKSYVIFGKRSGFSSMLNVDSLNGTNGFVLIGKTAGDRVGWSVSSAGDVNGDRIDDVIIGAPYATDTVIGLTTGKSYIIFGKSCGFAASLALSSLDAKNGVVITGEEEGDYLGFSVSGVGGCEWG